MASSCASILSRNCSPARSGARATPVRFTGLHTCSSGFSPHFSSNWVHWGPEFERIVLRSRFFSSPQEAPMPTECTPALFEFPPVAGRRVEASFDGDAITSDAGALLLSTGRSG